jgi:hypothetical protein
MLQSRVLGADAIKLSAEAGGIYAARDTDLFPRHSSHVFSTANLPLGKMRNESRRQCTFCVLQMALFSPAGSPADE